MVSQQLGRRLTVIAFTDMVGFSAMTQSNESKTLELLKEHQRMVRALLPAWQGREIKTLGDGFMLEFPSALVATGFAIAFQKLQVAYNAVPPERRFQIRIGIHLGDIEARGDDVFGDGVNIAARIEPHSPPGGVAVSASVHAQVANKVSAQFRSIGAPALKNIAMPVEVFVLDAAAIAAAETPQPTADTSEFAQPPPQRRAITAAAAAAAIAVLVTAASLWYVRRPAGPATEERSIAVLPLRNESGNPADEYFSDGLTEELISALGQVRGLKVIGRQSSFQFKNKNEEPRTIGEKLHVNHLLEGSVRKDGDRVRIVAELVSASDGADVWTQTYSRDLKDIFAVQGELASAVAQALAVRLANSPAPSRGKAINPEAHNALLEGKYVSNQGDEKKAAEFFEEALRLDPEYAEAYSRLSIAKLDQAFFASGETAATLNAASRQAARRALELDPNLAIAHRALGYAFLYADWNVLGAQAEIKRALELAPEDAGSIIALADVMSIAGRTEESMALYRKAIALNPLAGGAYGALGAQLCRLGRYDEARDAYAKDLEIAPHFPGATSGWPRLRS